MNKFGKLAMISATAILAGCGGSSSSGGAAGVGNYSATSLVSDQSGGGLTDPNLVNPWGIAISPTGGDFWISDNGTNKTTLYGGDVNGTALTVISLVVGVPGGSPTGQVFNSSTGFVVASGAQSAPAIFILASEAGVITGWNPTVPTPSPSTSAQTGITVTGAVFKGLAIGTTGGATFVYATDFASGKVRTFDSTYTETNTGAFVDANIPTGYAPFGIQNLGDVLYVTYALKGSGIDDVAGAGHGFVDKFDLSGNFLGRFISQGHLNSPWGLAKAPSTFGTFANDILVGNFGDGLINVYDPTSGNFLGSIGSNGKAITIPYLWGIAFGNGVTAGNTNTLYFTAGTGAEAHGMFGKITGS